MRTLRNLRILSISQPPRKPSAISAITPMPEDFLNGRRGVSRLPAVSPLMHPTTGSQAYDPKRPARHPSSPHPLRCRKTCPDGQSGTGRLTLSDTLRPPNLRPFLNSLGCSIAVSVTRPSLHETSSPTYPFRSSRVRLRTSSASLRSPQTCCPTSALPRMLRFLRRLYFVSVKSLMAWWISE